MLNCTRLCELRILVIVALALVTIQSWSQENRGGAILRSTARLVNVNLVVTDSQGQPVRDLTKDSFVVLDGRNQQKIGFFSSADNGQPSPTSSSLNPDLYSNNQADGGVTASPTILLFDTLNSHWSSQGYGLERVRGFLRQIEPQDHIGIYVLGDDLKLVHDIKRDASDLVTAIRRYDEGRSNAPTERAAAKVTTGDPNLDRFLAGKENHYRFAAEHPQPGIYTRTKLAEASQTTIASLQAIARQLSAVPGRKTLIWVTDRIGDMGWFVSDDLDESLGESRKRAGGKLSGTHSYRNGEDVERMVRLMNDAGIAIYPVSAEGLEAEDLGFRNTGGGDPSQGAVDDVLSRLPDPRAHADMSELASRTGGRAF